jgi:hypothetical protein
VSVWRVRGGGGGVGGGRRGGGAGGGGGGGGGGVGGGGGLSPARRRRAGRGGSPGRGLLGVAHVAGVGWGGCVCVCVGLCVGGGLGGGRAARSRTRRCAQRRGDAQRTRATGFGRGGVLQTHARSHTLTDCTLSAAGALRAMPRTGQHPLTAPHPPLRAAPSPHRSSRARARRCTSRPACAWCR